MKGKVKAINISVEKGTVKTSVSSCQLIEHHGFSGDAHAGDWHRQVSLLADESVDKMRALGANQLVSGIFAENITTTGIELYTLPIGTQLSIGDSILEVTQIGKECHHGCAIQKQVGQCVMPREGIFAVVVQGGLIHEGDDIEVRLPLSQEQAVSAHE